MSQPSSETLLARPVWPGVVALVTLAAVVAVLFLSTIFFFRHSWNLLARHSLDHSKVTVRMFTVLDEQNRVIDPGMLILSKETKKQE
ncbi:hypothetical protein JCM10908_002243 [Rhodotorula pacifica]|uniref:uncharacterized protein n=1 Tax=Rhodotorula pacifica TaxID=1495444 RepID=UPI003170B60F